MGTYTVKSSGGDYTTLHQVLTAIQDNTAPFNTDIAHTIVLYQEGARPVSYTYNGKAGVARTRVNPITFRPATAAENGGTPVDITIGGSAFTAGSITNMRSIWWDCSTAGASRIRFRGLWTFNGATGTGSTGGCHNWRFIGDRTQDNSAWSGLDGEATDPATSTPWLGNLFVQYGHKWDKLNDDILYDGVSFVMRRESTSSGYRGWNTVPALKTNSAFGGTQARHCTNWQIRNCEVAYYAADGMKLAGLGGGSVVEDNEIHHLYPQLPDNYEHIDGIEVPLATDLTIQRNDIHHILWQGAIIKCLSSAGTYTTDRATYESIQGFRFLHNNIHDIGGDYLTGAPGFTPSDTFVDFGVTKTYGSVGGTGMVVTNIVEALVDGNVVVDNIGAAGCEVDYQFASQPFSITGAGDQHIDITNNVFSWVASEISSTKIGLNIGDPGFDGTWKNNLQTEVKSSTATYIVVPAQVGDVATGTSPLWDANYRPLTGSPLIDAGYASTNSTGLTRLSTDFEGTTWSSPRNIGLYETDAGAPTLNADAGIDLSAFTNVALPLSASDSTVSSGTITYAWTKVSGPGTVTFSNAAVAQPTATMNTAGSYVLRVTVSTVESPGTTDTDDVTVTVTDYVAPTPGAASLLGSGVYVIGGLPHVFIVPA
jgi:hypothetical protein